MLRKAQSRTTDAFQPFGQLLQRCGLHLWEAVCLHHILVTCTQPFSSLGCNPCFCNGQRQRLQSVPNNRWEMGLSSPLQKHLYFTFKPTYHTNQAYISSCCLMLAGKKQHKGLIDPPRISLLCPGADYFLLFHRQIPPPSDALREFSSLCRVRPSGLLRLQH